MGAQTFLQTPEFQNRTTESHGGEPEFIGDIIDYALMLDNKADERQEELTGVFLYEVAEQLCKRRFF